MNIEETFNKVLALSKPPVIINQGLPTEALVYSKKRYPARIGRFPFGCDHITISSEQYREIYLSETSFEQDIWVICKPNKELANAVYDYAKTLINIKWS